MTGKCPACGNNVVVRVRRGDRISNHLCPECRVPLQGVTAGSSRGRYQCPITGDVVVLGLMSAVQLDKPYRLVFSPGTDWNGQFRDSPDDSEQRALNRVAGRILGPGCVISSRYRPEASAGDSGEIREAGRARLQLISVAHAPGGDRDWIINSPLTFRKCLGCGAPVADTAENRLANQWVPRQESVWRGRGRARRLKPTNPGPHPAGTPACTDCRPLAPGEKGPAKPFFL